MNTPLLEILELDCGSLAGVGLTLSGGECVGLMGPSGAGKTRLLRAIADLDPHAGELRLRGEPCERLPGHRWRQRVGYLPAESHWWTDRVGEHLPATEPALLEALGFGTDVLDWEVARLSSGERQRLALARLLSGRPEVLLLDEPTANLDPASAERVEAVLADAQGRGAGLIWVSHDEAQLRRRAQRAFVIVDGHLEPLAWT